MRILMHKQMKRRGFVPDLRVYTTLFSCFITIRDWGSYGKLLEQVGQLHSHYLEYANTIKKTNPDSPELSTLPTRAYIRILGRAGKHEEMWDVLNFMEETGPLPPDLITYHLVLEAVGQRQLLGLSPDARLALGAESASQGKLLWRQMLKYVENNPSAQLDSYTVSAMLGILARGTPTDVLYAFDIIRDYLGLSKPGETAKPAVVQLESFTFHRILELGIYARKYRLTIHYYDQVVETQPALVDNRHVECVLRAHASLAALNSDDYEAPRALDKLLWLLKEWAVAGKPKHLEPKSEHFDSVLCCCHRTASWSVATHTFEALTGYRAADFADDEAAARAQRPCPPRDPPSKRNHNPDYAFLSHFVRTALHTGDPAIMRQCLRIVQCVQPRWELPEDYRNLDPSANTRFNVHNNARFYFMRMASDVIKLIDVVVPKDVERDRYSEQEGKWMKLRRTAVNLYKEGSSLRKPVTPFLAEDLLGSRGDLATLDRGGVPAPGTYSDANSESDTVERKQHIWF